MAAVGWDRGGVYYADPLNAHQQNQSGLGEAELVRRCGRFLEHFRIDNQFIYREQLRRNVANGQFFLAVDLSHVQSFDEQLATRLLSTPLEVISQVYN